MRYLLMTGEEKVGGVKLPRRNFLQAATAAGVAALKWPDLGFGESFLRKEKVGD